MEKIFSDLLNCVNNSSVDTCQYKCDTSYEDLEVSAEEVTHAIKKLDVNKACGSDGVLVPLLSMCFTSCIALGFLPDSMLSVVLVPVIKDKASEISSKDSLK